MGLHSVAPNFLSYESLCRLGDIRAIADLVCLTSPFAHGHGGGRDRDKAQPTASMALLSFVKEMTWKALEICVNSFFNL